MPTIQDLLHEAWQHPDDAAALSRIGRELQSRSRLEEARDLLERAVDLAPGDVEAWADLSYTFFRSMREEEGRDALRRGIEATGSDILKAVLANFSSGDEAEALWKELAASPLPGVQASHASHRFWAGDKDEALASLRALVQEHEADPHVRDAFLWTLIGARARDAVEGLDLHAEGLPTAQALVDEEPDSVRGHWFRLQMLHAEKDWAGLLAETEAALARFPDEETTMLFRARAHRELGDRERARNWMLRAIGAKPSYVGARIELGRLHEAMDDLEAAEEVFREIGVANPAYRAGPVSLALFLARHERWDEAEPVFLEAWPHVHPMFRAGMAGNPEVQALLERDAVKAGLDS